MSKNFVYQGTELDLFSKATHWKAYWGTIVAKYLGERVLEVGAGSGTTARLLCKTQHKSWLALEPDAHLAKQIARDKEAGLLPAAVSVQVGTLAGLEQSANFDTILYIDVLEHIAGDRTELQLAFNFLAPGGFLIVLAPAHQFLFTPFDASIGHFRRYDRRSLLDIAPAGLSVETARYLDSAGLLASLGNRFILKSSMPTPGQIKFWDSWLVPASTVLDPITLYNLGKSILVVWRKSAPPS